MPQTRALLLDVDNTLLVPSRTEVGQVVPNDGLLQALRQVDAESTVFFLLTAWQSKFNLKPNALKGASRFQVCQLLEKIGIKVAGVVVTGSPYWEAQQHAPFGAYYDTVVSPLERKLLGQSAEAIAEICLQPEVQAAMEAEQKLLLNQSQNDRYQGEAYRNGKEALLRWNLQHIQKAYPGVKDIRLLDDNLSVLKVGEQVAGEPELKASGVLLHVIEVQPHHPKQDEAYFRAVLHNALAETLVRAPEIPAPGSAKAPAPQGNMALPLQALKQTSGKEEKAKSPKEKKEKDKPAKKEKKDKEKKEKKQKPLKSPR